MIRKKGSLISGFFIFGCCLLVASLSLGAEVFPTRPITLINPMGAGGAHDIHARLLTSVAAEYLGQPLVLSMKTGGGGIIGSAFVARSKPDGYTLLLGGASWNTVACQMEDAGFTKDSFIPVAKINHLPYVVAVKATKPWKTLDDLLNYIRTSPKKVIHGRTGYFTVLLNSQILSAAKVDTPVATVPFKGVGDQILSILKEDSDYMVQIYLGLVPYIQSKEIRVLAVLDEKRVPALPDVPTAKELGYDVTQTMWIAVLAPKGTPQEAVEKLSSAFDKMVKDSSFVSMMKKMEVPLYYEDRKTFSNKWDNEYKLYGTLIEKLGLKMK